MSLKEAIKTHITEQVNSTKTSIFLEMEDIEELAEGIEEVVLEYLENEELQELDNVDEDLLDDDDNSFNGVF
jgi:hypothetical protein